MKISFLNKKKEKKEIMHPLLSNTGEMKSSEKKKVWNEITRQAVQDQQEVIQKAKDLEKQRQS